MCTELTASGALWPCSCNETAEVEVCTDQGQDNMYGIMIWDVLRGEKIRTRVSVLKNLEAHLRGERSKQQPAQLGQSGYPC